MAISKKCKELLCLFYTGLLFMSGIVLIVLSIYLGYKLVHHFKFVSTEYIGPFITIFLLAFVHILISWLGIKGPTKEHLFHIVLFMAISFLLIISEIAVGIWSMVLWNKVFKNSILIMHDSFSSFLKDNYDKYDWVKLQSELHCCGLNSTSDYIDSVPNSCRNVTTTTYTLYQQGCTEPLVSYVKSLMLKIALVGFGSGICQILGIIIFYYFYKAIREEITARAAARIASRLQEGNPLNRRSSKDSARQSVGRQNPGTAVN